MRAFAEWYARRRARKAAHRLLRDAKHLRHMREDVAPPHVMARTLAAEEALRRACRHGSAEEIRAKMNEVGAALEGLAPAHDQPRLRENLEVLVVAVAVAMGVRTYFVQPFKIPTGSMQPTLYGVTVQPQIGRRWYDYFPVNLVPLALFGERYREVRARADGRVEMMFGDPEEPVRLLVGGVPHDLPRSMILHVQPGRSVVRKGDLLASGRVRLGDHIFVNKVIYNFARPKRGDIFVFSTAGIQYPRIRQDSFYIKRIAGLPGENITLDPPYLYADGRPIREPEPFRRLQRKELGYHGYQWPMTDGRLPLALGRPGQVLRLKENEYLPLGDNTLSSLDGRYFGGVDRRNIVGPAFMVYWPFGSRWGLIR